MAAEMAERGEIFLKNSAYVFYKYHPEKLSSLLGPVRGSPPGQSVICPEKCHSGTPGMSKHIFSFCVSIFFFPIFPATFSCCEPQVVLTVSARFKYGLTGLILGVFWMWGVLFASHGGAYPKMGCTENPRGLKKPFFLIIIRLIR